MSKLRVANIYRQAPAPELKPAADTTGGEADERTRARLRTELAAGYFERGNMSVAVEEVTQALRADPSYGPAHNVAGVIYAALKEDRLAEQSFAQALRINPQDSDANHNYGWFLCQRKREAEGIGHFMAAVRNPLYQMPERSYVNAAACARRSGDVAAAEEYLNNALRARPGYPPALYQLADIAYARGQYPAARTYLGSLTRVAVSTAEVLWLGVRVERKLGDRNAEGKLRTAIAEQLSQLSRGARAAC